MPVSLRVVLDQLVDPTSSDLEAASRGLALALIDTAPLGCRVEAIAPVGGQLGVPGLADEARIKRLRTQWPLGLRAGAGRGMIHSPTLMAPLQRHDRVNDGEQVVVTVWDLSPWESVSDRHATGAATQRALLRRAAHHADAVVVPSHVMADRIAEHARLDERVRVIPGAVEASFAEPSDAAARRRDLSLPEEYVVTSGGTVEADGLATALRAVSATSHDVVVIDSPEDSEASVLDLAASAGLPERRVHVRGALDTGDRAAAIGGAAAFVAASTRNAWPWRATEAMSLGTPLVAVDSPVHREVIYDGGIFVRADDLGDALRSVLGSGGGRLRLLGLDRARAFTWIGAAEKVWQLHADL